MVNNTISYKIEITSSGSSNNDREYLNHHLKIFTKKLDDRFDVIDSNIVVKHDVETSHTELYKLPTDQIKDEQPKHLHHVDNLPSRSANYFGNKDFDRYVRALPKYRISTPKRYESMIRDYLVKNRSSKISDIIEGCRAQGIKIEAHDPFCIFYKTLRKLLKSGDVTKENGIYFWNYKDPL